MRPLQLTYSDTCGCRPLHDLARQVVRGVRDDGDRHDRVAPYRRARAPVPLPQPDRTGCARAAAWPASCAAGIEHETVRVPYRRRDRPEVEELTGQRRVPVVVLDEQAIVRLAPDRGAPRASSRVAAFFA